MMQVLNEISGNGQTMTTHQGPVTSNSVQFWPYEPNYTGDYWRPWYPQPYVAPYCGYERIVAPADCSGDIHVFPCPHCDKCKCGGATKAKEKRR